MAFKNEHSKQNESSLLLKVQNSMFAFDDMSGNSILMPVAVNNFADDPNASAQNSMSFEQNARSQHNASSALNVRSQHNMSTEQSAGSRPNMSSAVSQRLPEASVCQLEQPLLMRTVPSSMPPVQSYLPCAEPNTQSVASYTQASLYSSTVQKSPPSLQAISQAQLPAQSSNIYSAQPFQSGIYSKQPIQFDYSESSIQSITTTNNAADQSSSVSSTSGTSHMFNAHPNFSGSYINCGVPEVSTVPFTNYSGGEPVSIASTTTAFFQPHESQTVNAASIDYGSRSTPSQSPGSLSYSYGASNINQTNMFDPSRNQSTASSNIVLNPEMLCPVKPYWLFRDIVETKDIWFGFSNSDSEKLEAALHHDNHAVVSTDGGRYDAYLGPRLKKSVYFEAKDLHIRRCTWFYRSDSSQKFVPFDEDAANVIESNFSLCITSGQWQKRINIPGVGCVVFESPDVMLLYANELETWPSMSEFKANPKSLKRGLPEGFELMPDETSKIDHLVFIVQGIGSFCDLRFRTVSQCVDGFRDIANKLITSHFKQHVERGKVGKVEFLPLAWHARLHTSDIGLDRRMEKITLPSIPKLRHFTNDTLLDILLYSSPQYCQSIIDTVANELNRLYKIFLSRNPEFSGKIFVAGHSLGSLILFDILANQNSGESENLNAKADKKENNERNFPEFLPPELHEFLEMFEESQTDINFELLEEEFKAKGLPSEYYDKLLIYLQSVESRKGSECSNAAFKFSQKEKVYETDLMSSGDSAQASIYPLRALKTGMSSIIYPRLHFEPACFFALGSPISMFLAVRGYDTISEDFRFPTCSSFFHIFHPYDPVAFRIEPLIDPNFLAKPVMIPHHKGRKRMHLEIRENLTKVGIEIKQKLIETLRYTWNSISGFASHAFPSAAVEAEMEKIVTQQISESENETQEISETSGEELQIGCLNGGRRIDYVLQEKPIEALNDYIFALTSHATYWDSEDTVLMILREIYSLDGIVICNESRSISHSASALASGNASSDAITSTAFKCESVSLESQEINPGFVSFHNDMQNVSLPSPNPNFAISTSDNIPSTLQMQNETILPPPVIPSSQPLGPPPLTGFVKKSPFGR